MHLTGLHPVPCGLGDSAKYQPTFSWSPASTHLLAASPTRCLSAVVSLDGTCVSFEVDKNAERCRTGLSRYGGFLAMEEELIEADASIAENSTVGFIWDIKKQQQVFHWMDGGGSLGLNHVAWSPCVLHPAMQCGCLLERATPGPQVPARGRDNCAPPL